MENCVWEEYLQQWFVCGKIHGRMANLKNMHFYKFLSLAFNIKMFDPFVVNSVQVVKGSLCVEYLSIIKL